MISKERLMELLTEAGRNVGFVAQRVPPGYVEFAKLVEREVRTQQATAVAAIKQSYRRLEYGANAIRIQQETDGILDTLTVPGAPELIGSLRVILCVEALTELVRLKRIKERIEHLVAANVSGSHDEHNRLLAEYEAGKDQAWQAAFDALEGK